MKKVLGYIAGKLHYIANFKRYRNLQKIEKEVRAAYIKKSKKQIIREAEQEVLKRQITKHIRKFHQADANSRFIKKGPRNNSAVRAEVLRLFGDEMKECGLSLSKTLRFVCIP